MTTHDTLESSGDWVDPTNVIPKKNILELSEQQQPNAEWVFFTLGLRFGDEHDQSTLEIFGLNPETSQVYHVIDFQLSDYSDFDDSFCQAGKLPDKIGFAAWGTELFIVVGQTASFYTCDLISGRKWEKGPRLVGSKRNPLLFVVGHNLFALSREARSWLLHTEFEKLDLKQRSSWDALPNPPFLSTIPINIYCAIDQEHQEIYFPTPYKNVGSDLSVFDCITCRWCSYYEDEDYEDEIGPLILNLMQFPRWDGCAQVLYGKIYLIDNNYLEPGLDFDQFSCLIPKVAIIGYNLNALPPQNLTDAAHMTPKRIIGLNKYLTHPWKFELQYGVVVPLGRGGRFCYAAYLTKSRDAFKVSMHAAVFNLRLDHIKDDFPNEVEKVTLREFTEKLPNDKVVKAIVRVREKLPEEQADYRDGDVVIEEPVLRPQGAVVESFYEFAQPYFPWEVQVGQDYVAE